MEIYIVIGSIVTAACLVYARYTVPYPDDKFLLLLSAILCIMGGILWPATVVLSIFALIIGFRNKQND